MLIIHIDFMKYVLVPGSIKSLLVLFIILKQILKQI